MKNLLYVFVDESGNLDFSEKGTRFYVLAAVTALFPLDSSNALQDLKYQLLANGVGGQEFQYFHASEDSQEIRNKVFGEITKMENIKLSYITAEKIKTDIDYQGYKFYGLLGFRLIQELLKEYCNSEYEKVIIIFDQALTRKEQDSFLKKVKPQLKSLRKAYAIYFHRTMSDFNGQIADYCAWAKYVSLERNEMRPIKELLKLPISSIDIFSS